VCLPNTSLSKNQKHKKYFKIVFDKHALRKKNISSLVKIKHAKHAFKVGLGWARLTQSHRLGLLSSRSKSTHMALKKGSLGQLL
jgi:hypothetical protein